jgi:hypothetical protein
MPGYETLEAETVSGYGEFSSLERNPLTGELTAIARNDGAYRYPWGTQSFGEVIEHKTSDQHPGSTSVTGSYFIRVELPERTLLWETEMSFTSDREHFYYRYFRKLTENDVLIREKHWQKTFPRDFQ